MYARVGEPLLAVWPFCLWPVAVYVAGVLALTYALVVWLQPHLLILGDEAPVGLRTVFSAWSCAYLLMCVYRVLANYLALRFASRWKDQDLTSPAARLPTVDVVVPAFNEGTHIGACLAALAASDYPRDRMRILCVDDGSSDDTWEIIERFRQSSSVPVHAIRLVHNKGKKVALATAFVRSTADIVVTVDADCRVSPAAVRLLAEKLAAEATSGAVAGWVQTNATGGVWSRMLHPSFLLSFGFHRAAESSYGMVQCCPGALSAFRRELVLAVLRPWLASSFLGALSTIGEDRTLTNLILGMGYKTVFEDRATCVTAIPDGYAAVARMLLRWQRSSYRESLMTMGLVLRSSSRLRRTPMGSVNALNCALLETSQAALWPQMLVLAIWLPGLTISLLIAALFYGILLGSTLVRGMAGWRGAIRFIQHVFAYLLCYSWVETAALVSVTSNRWHRTR